MGNSVRPVLKWAGGKQRLAPEIKKYVPKFKCYFEPFLGAGAIFFAIRPQTAFLNDINADLINVYKVILQKPQELLQSLKRHKNEAGYYYLIREFDRDPGLYRKLGDVERASRFIYLNKTCYNGLFRVNKKGQFNVPFGRYKKPDFVNETGILAVSDLFNSSSIHFSSCDFEEHLKGTEKGDFVYLDPPYDPTSKTSSFTSYARCGFAKDDQLRLRYACDHLTEKGTKFLLSNSSTEYIKGLYSGYEIIPVQAKRTINCHGQKRGFVKEVIIKNY